MANASSLFGGGTFPLTNGTAGSGTILPAFVGDGLLGLASISANQLNAVPFFTPVNISVDALAFDNSGTANSGHNVRLGLFASLPSGLPGALIDETGQITLDANRDIRVAAIGSTQTLLANTPYWIAIVGNNTISLIGGSGAFAEGPGIAYTRLGNPVWNAGFPTYNGTNYLSAIYVSHTYGAMPDPFGTPTGAATPKFLGVQVA